MIQQPLHQKHLKRRRSRLSSRLHLCLKRKINSTPKVTLSKMIFWIWLTKMMTQHWTWLKILNRMEIQFSLPILQLIHLGQQDTLNSQDSQLLQQSTTLLSTILIHQRLTIMPLKELQHTKMFHLSHYSHHLTQLSHKDHQFNKLPNLLK